MSKNLEINGMEITCSYCGEYHLDNWYGLIEEGSTLECKTCKKEFLVNFKVQVEYDH